MKKRILAMLLVLCLVMSVMPMTVLAAEAECPEEHTVDNCKYTLVDTVPAKDCATPGYELYICDACGEPFVDVKEELGGHKYVVNSKLDGKVACSKKECEVCHEAMPHAYDCEGKCSVCGNKDDKQATHKWDYEHAEVIKAPASCEEDGIVKYTCTLCGETQEAAIAAAHVWGEWNDAVPATCEQAGKIKYRQCAVCQAYQNENGEIVDSIVAPAHHIWGYETYSFINEEDHWISHKVSLAPNTNGYIVIMLPVVTTADKSPDCGYNAGTMTDIPDGVETIVEVPAGVGLMSFITRARKTLVSLDVIIINKDAATRIPGEPCTPVSYKVACTRCAAANVFQVVTGSQPQHKWVVTDGLEATCLRAGYEVRRCSECNKHEYKILDQLDCTDTYAEAQAYAAEKNEAGVILHPNFITTTAPSCTVKGSHKWNCAECGRGFTYDIPATGYIKAELTIAPTVHHKGATLVYCANGANCTCKCICTAKALADNGKCTCYFSKTQWINSYDGVAIMIPDADGNLVPSYIRVYEVKNEQKALDPKKSNVHDWVLDESRTNIFCGNEQGVKVYECSVCGIYDYEHVVNIPHSGYTTDPNNTKLPQLQKKAATCQEDGYFWYACGVCGDPIIVSEIKYEYKSLLNLDELKEQHGLLSGDVDWITAAPDNDCETREFGTAYCPLCEKDLFVVNYSEHVIDPKAIPKADCTKGDMKYDIDCKNCDQKVEVEVKAAHTLPNPGVASSCTVNGYKAWGECSVCKTFVKQEFLGYKHDPKVLHVHEGDCDSFAGTLNYCKVCKEIELVGFQAEVHDYELVESSEIDCIEGGYEKYVCADCGDVKVIDIPATGYHVSNLNGTWKIDYTACPECNIALNPGFSGVWGDHMYQFQNCCGDLREWTGSEPTCQKAGYKLYMYDCKHGNQFVYYPKLEECVFDAVNHGAYWTRVCRYCGKEEVVLNNQYLPVFDGISLNMDSSVNAIPNDIVTEGTEITILVSLAGLNKEVWGYDFDVYYDGNYAEFIGFEMLTENFQYNAIVNPNVTKTPIKDGKGNVIGYDYSNHHISVIGSIKLAGENFKLNGEEALVALKFQVKNVPAIHEDNAGVLNFWFGEDISVSYNITVPNYGKYPVSYSDTEIMEMYDRDEMATGIELGTTLLMDADGNGTVHFNDAILIWNMVSGVVENNYSSIVDVNGNGVVDAVDATLIFRYLTGMISYEDILNYHA